MQSRRFTGIAAFVAAGLVLTACATPATKSADEAGPPVRGGNLTVRLAQDPGSLDTVRNTNAGTTYVGHEVFEQLVTIDAGYQPQPVLAESYKKSDDGLGFTFTLRKGIVFSDGTPLRAADAAASLRYWVENGSYAGSLKPVLKEISAPDEQTVQVDLTAPFNLVALVATSHGTGIRKEADIKAAGPTGIGRDNAIGTGPYKVKSWTPGQEIVLERNDKYQAPPGKSSGYAGAKNAYLDTITYKIVADSDAVLNGLQTGLFDVAEPSHDQYDQVKRDSTLKIGVEGAANIQYVALNHNAGSIFSKPEAREAMNLIVDKKAVMASQGVPDLVSASNGAFAAQSNKAMYSDAAKSQWDQSDPQRAKELFAAAGLKPDQTVRMITTDEFPQFKDALVIIQDALKKIGVNATIDSYDFATLMGRKNTQPDSWDVLALMDDANPPVPSYSDNVQGLDNMGYPRDKLAPLLTKYNAARTPEEQKAAIDDIQKFTAANLPTITLYSAKSYVAFSAKVRGYDGWGMEFADVWLAR
ncbi:ABC transporter substrate-binding protein [Saccharothrix violaceirubra]|uniref:Peptide/nickel transport system substrate-binding protein n=1 Tax=Saccharothrix violaceirubra TaxID=413306 RepID=A0A7W7T4J2_9PSEU|nr:ABC transporter substrate-binding protein [Saccharothrix violaceirubra]MBB4966429.1 peptide/nickel transport system substrate-binding protein [Saccharothrix violaceirubra]